MTDQATDHFSRHHYAADHIAGPVTFLNPTTRLHALPKPKQHSSPDSTDNDQHHGIYTLWRSRDNRKGRHALALTPSAADTTITTTTTTNSTTPPPTNTLHGTLQGLARMALRYPIWDVSYDVAAIFTLGSVVWVINGFLVLLPTTNPPASFSGESAWGGGVSAVVGATIFEVGSVLLMLEAVNENRTACFGWAVEEEERALLGRVHPVGAEGCRHHHVDRKGFLRRRMGRVDEDQAAAAGGGGGGGEEKQLSEGRAGQDDDDGASELEQKRRSWTWWPSWYELRTYYFRDIGFLACLSQMIGATVFWISGFTGLPPILDVLSLPAENGIYWLPQVSSAIIFLALSCLSLMILCCQSHALVSSFQS